MILRHVFLYTSVLILTQVSLALAADATPQTIRGVFNGFILRNVTGLFAATISVAVVTFLVGMVRFVKAGDNEEARQAGRQVMIYGIVVLFIMVSFWGIVKLVTMSLFDSGPEIPNFLPALSDKKQ